jgi:hypothetical protein
MADQEHRALRLRDRVPRAAGVDISKMDADGKAIERWGTLQVVGDPKNSAPLIAPNIPRANPNGIF